MTTVRMSKILRAGALFRLATQLMVMKTLLVAMQTSQSHTLNSGRPPQPRKSMQITKQGMATENEVLSAEVSAKVDAEIDAAEADGNENTIGGQADQQSSGNTIQRSPGCK